MRLVRTHRTSPLLFQIVPLLDILFAILIFLILSVTFVSQPGIDVEPPSSHFSVEPALGSQIVSILNSSQIFFRDRLVTPEQLTSLLQNKSSNRDTMILRADRSVPYDQVMKVANLLLSNGYRVVLATAVNEKTHSSTAN